MDLLVVQLKAAIRRLLDTKGVRGRVLDKVNRYGEVVIGVILERPVAGPTAVPPCVTTNTTRDGDGEKGGDADESGEIAKGRAAR